MTGRGTRHAALGALVGMVLVVASVAPAQDSAAVRRRWLFLPGLGWSPETGLAAAFTVITMATPPGDTTARSSSTSFYVLRTAKAQTRVSLDVDRWYSGNKRRILASLGAVKYPYSFYGFGDSTSAAQEERYVPRWIEGYVQVDERVRPRVYALYGVRAGYQEITPDTAGLLHDHLVPGSGATRTMILTLGATYDSRDHNVSTHHGQLASIAYGRSAPFLGATYSYGRLDAEWRAFRELAARGVLGVHASIVKVDGTVPFDQMAVIGGGRIMRGYSAGRFRDRLVVAMQSEYRSPLFYERLGAVAFAGVGAAAPRPGLLGQARPFPSAGIGGRWQVDPVQRTGLRVDYAVGAYGFGGLYVSFNQAF